MKTETRAGCLTSVLQCSVSFLTRSPAACNPLPPAVTPMSPTSASPSWTPGPGRQDVSRRPAPGALGLGWGEGGESPGDAHSPEPGASARPPPSDSGRSGDGVARVARVGGSGRDGPCPCPCAGSPGRPSLRPVSVRRGPRLLSRLLWSRHLNLDPTLRGPTRQTKPRAANMAAKRRTPEAPALRMCHTWNLLFSKLSLDRDAATRLGALWVMQFS